MIRDYEIQRSSIIGEGASKVFHATHRRNKSDSAAAKILTLSQSNEFLLQSFMNEVSILSKLNSDYTVKLLSSGIEDNCGVLILEKMECDLMDLILEEKLSLKHKLSIFYDICKAVKYCHDNNVVHLDLKPENVLIKFNQDKYNIRLADFGNSCIVDKDGKVLTAIGTLQYNAPEVINEHPDGIDGKKADIWSLGILFHVLLTNSWPISSIPGIDIIDILSCGRISISESLSIDHQSFLYHLLKIDPEYRPSINEVLEKLDSMNYDTPHQIPRVSKVDKSNFIMRKWVSSFNL